jgi:hypothetical protein
VQRFGGGAGLHLRPVPTWAQANDPISTTLCEIAKDPSAFDGKLIRVRGTIISGFEAFTLTDKTCASDYRVWLESKEPPLSKAAEYALIESLADLQHPEKLTWVPVQIRPPVIVFITSLLV